MVPPRPEFRPLVRALAEGQFREPVVVVHLGDVGPEYRIEGRRKDGTIKGKRLILRFFWNLIRIPVGVVVSLFGLVHGGSLISAFDRDGTVQGSANAQALGLVDAARAATSAWLVFSDSQVGLVDAGSVFGNPADNGPPRLIWHEAAPHGPRVRPYQQELVWPDGSVFRFHLTQEERQVLKAG